MGTDTVHSWVEEGQHGMDVDKGEESNKGVLHILVDIGVYLT
jgi:hypothetical protein